MVYSFVVNHGSFFSRTVLATLLSKNPKDRFNLLLGEVSSLSAVVSGQGAQLSVLNDQMLITRCQMYEDTCGRINQENLSHFMVMGAPYYALAENIQDTLKKQVTKSDIFLDVGNFIRSTDINVFQCQIPAVLDWDIRSQVCTLRQGSQSPQVETLDCYLLNFITDFLNFTTGRDLILLSFKFYYRFFKLHFPGHRVHQGYQSLIASDRDPRPAVQESPKCYC